MNSKKNSIPISYIGGSSGLGHMLKIKANISGQETILIFDTGIGVNLISKSLCSKLKCKIEGSVTGKRMTGQSVTIPMTKVANLKVANNKQHDVDVGVLDLDSFLPKKPEFDGVQGYLSLNFLKKQPFTIDYKSGMLTLDTEEELIKRIKNAEIIPITKKTQGLALTIQIPVKTQIEKSLDMQLDLGTNIMTIGSKFLGSFQPQFDITTLKKDSIIDETGFKRERVYVKLNGYVSPLSDNLLLQRNPTVMFQDIIYDGIIGDDFFKGRIVTYDLENSRLIINRK